MSLGSGSIRGGAERAGASQDTASFLSTYLSDLPELESHDPAVRRDSLLADHIRTLYEQTAVTLLANGIGVGVVAWMYGGLASPFKLGLWVFVALMLLTLRTWLYRSFPHGAQAPLDVLVRWRRRWNGVAFATAAVWGSAVWLFYELGTDFHLLGLVLLVYAYMLAGVQLLATQPRVYLLFITIGLVPTIVRVALDGSDDFHLQLASIMVIVFLLTFGLAVVYRRAFDSTIRLKVQTEHLADQLRLEKVQAEEARRTAEVANRAKTQFFAAASHDLRQPLHALGLFAEALRQRSHDVEVAHLVNSINSSVDALEGLFSELLDITRIDTGGVEVRPQHMSVAELFARLRLVFEPIAFEKGLALRFRGQHWFAFADPVLVERILRNLVSNAIRYTHDGTVLVGCRRRGQRLLIQVWDSGVGIRQSELPRIFEEFYQVPDDTVLAPHQRKGLGLGLAIVKRLATLMHAPLTVRSESGKGTVFTLEIPLGRAQPQTMSSSSRQAPIGLTLDRRQILVVEDEPAVRIGLEVLLKSWGATVHSFDGASTAEAWAAGLPPDHARPDLLIVDYRLEAGRTGVDAIRSLRRRFGENMPAIVVTGSTMSGHEEEAQHHRFHILIKPVVPNRLRAMIAFKLGVR